MYTMSGTAHTTARNYTHTQLNTHNHTRTTTHTNTHTTKHTQLHTHTHTTTHTTKHTQQRSHAEAIERLLEVVRRAPHLVDPYFTLAALYEVGRWCFLVIMMVACRGV